MKSSLKFLAMKPSEPKPAAPVASTSPVHQAAHPSLFTELCQSVKLRDPSSELLTNYQKFCRQEGFSPEVEHCLSFALHKHALHTTSRPQQKKVFSRLGHVLPQSFTLQEVLSCQRPRELREQLARAEQELAAAKDEIDKLHRQNTFRHEAHLEIESHLNETVRERDASLQQQAKHIELMQTSLTAQQSLFCEQRQLHEEERRLLHQQHIELQDQLSEACVERNEMAEQLNDELATTEAFFARQFRYSRPSTTGYARRRPASDARVRPTSLVFPGSPRPPLP